MKRWLIFIFLLSTLSVKSNNTISNESKELSTEINKDDKNNISKLLELAELHPENADLQLKYLSRALQIATKNNWKPEIGLCYYKIGWYYLYNSDKNNTLKYFKECIANSDDLMLLINSHGILSNICSWAGYHEDALRHANEGIKVSEKSNSVIYKANAYLYLGDAYRYYDQRDKANYYYFQIINMLRDNDTPSGSLLQIVYLFTLVKDGVADFPMYLTRYALKQMKDYQNVSDLEKQIYAFSLMKVATAYNRSGRNEIIKQIELENNEKQKKFYIIGISILALLLTLLIWQNNSRKKSNKKLAEANIKLGETNQELAEANELKSRFFGILNHDLRRPIAGLISYLELKKKSSDIFDKEEQAAFEQKTIDLTQDLLENMEGLLFWCKSQMENFTPVFHEIKVSKLFDDTKSFFNTEREIDFVYRLPSDINIYTDINYLKTIMRNLTSNAIKAVQGVENRYIEWNAYEEENQVILSISNNGPEISQDKIDILYNRSGTENIKDGLGLIIIRDLAKFINCTIKVRSDKDRGTTFHIIFKNQ